MDGIYYLHKNNDLIYKHGTGNAADIRESDLAKSMWFFDKTDRESAWSILVEALSLGAKKSRILELAKKWKCDDNDADIYANRLNLVLELDDNAWCCHHINFTNMMGCPVGFGDTKLEAMAEFCKEIGYTGGKMWNASFKDLCED